MRTFVRVKQKNRTAMQNKKRLHKHLLIIYIIYFAVLVIGFLASFVPGFSRGWENAENDLAEEERSGSGRSYYVSVPLATSFERELPLEGLPENVTADIERIHLRVRMPEEYTVDTAFRTIADNGYAYLLLAVSGLAYLAIFVMIALIINSLRRSIRDEQPIRHSNIVRTRWIGVLILVAEASSTLIQHINHLKAAQLLEGTQLEVAGSLPFDYWNIIVGVLFLFMAEIFTIGTQLSEEQKLTI